MRALLAAAAVASAAPSAAVQDPPATPSAKPVRVVPTIARERGEPFSRQQREASYARREKEWRKVIGTCRRALGRPFLEQVDDAQLYRSIVESF